MRVSLHSFLEDVRFNHTGLGQFLAAVGIMLTAGTGVQHNDGLSFAYDSGLQPRGRLHLRLLSATLSELAVVTNK